MTIPREKYISTFNALPRVIRSYIVDDKISPVASDIGAKHSFHVDLIGKFTEDITYMLMGLMSPTELLGELVMSGVNAEDARSILAELNQRVFMPVREQVEKAAANPGDEDEDDGEDTQPQVEEAIVSENTPPPTSIPTHIEAAIPPAPVAVAAPAVQPTPETVPIPTAAMPQNIPTLIPEIRTMGHDIDVLQHSGNTPASTFQTASVPSSLRPSINALENGLGYRSAALDQTNSIITPSKVAEPEPISTIKPLSAPNVASGPVSYGSDPYREPVE